ncbi:MAG: hypothetical protein H0U52_16205 [Chloroflexi bacterium]|nr:hypothetical protein [Chloroflexota bacterium]
MASDRPVSLRLPSDLLEQIDRRTRKPDDANDREYGRADAIRGALNRYYETCRRHLARLGLSRSELGLVCEVLNGGMLGWSDDRSAALTVVWAEIADAVQLHPGYGKQWDLSDDAVNDLARRLQAAPYADLVALVDFVERFWADDPEATKAIYPDGES